MTRPSRIHWILLALLFSSGGRYAQATNITLLHEFARSGGSGPEGGLILSGSTLFGTTSSGGTIFSMNTDGTGFTLLRHSIGSSSASLTLSGSTLFGTTTAEGGTVFSINTDGTGFDLLREFAGGPNDGSRPEAGLTLSGSTLFGTTAFGGDRFGTVFSINTDGTGFTLLHEFTGPPFDDGAVPISGLTLSGSTLFGTASIGGLPVGLGGGGTIFSINTDGTGFTALHKFDTGPGGGIGPLGGLTLSGSTLFGTTASHGGSVFSINTDGTGFTVLHGFSLEAGPFGGLTLSGSTLFGTTFSGGDDDVGTIFSVNTDGTGFTLLHEFAGGPDDGAFPFGDLTLSGSTLFGTTSEGGDNNRGTVFSFVVPEPSTLVSLGIGMFALAAYGWRRRRTG